MLLFLIIEFSTLLLLSKTNLTSLVIIDSDFLIDAISLSIEIFLTNKIPSALVAKDDTTNSTIKTLKSLKLIPLILNWLTSLVDQIYGLLFT